MHSGRTSERSICKILFMLGRVVTNVGLLIMELDI